MRDKMQKRVQHQINKEVRKLNKDLLNDNLWRGRFKVVQCKHFWTRFSDGSGGMLVVILQVRDLKTGLFQTFAVDNYNVRYAVYDFVNNFIVFYSDVWRDIDKVKADKTDWTKVKWIPKMEV